MEKRSQRHVETREMGLCWCRVNKTRPGLGMGGTEIYIRNDQALFSQNRYDSGEGQMDEGGVHQETVNEKLRGEKRREEKEKWRWEERDKKKIEERIINRSAKRETLMCLHTFPLWLCEYFRCLPSATPVRLTGCGCYGFSDHAAIVFSLSFSPVCLFFCQAAMLEAVRTITHVFRHHFTPD